MGWSKVIKESDQNGGVVITSNGKAVALVVSLSEVSVDADELKEAFSHLYMGNVYSSMITMISTKIIKEMILEVKTDLMMKNDGNQNRMKYAIDWFKKAMTKKMEDVLEVKRLSKGIVSLDLREERDSDSNMSKVSKKCVSLDLGRIEIKDDD